MNSRTSNNMDVIIHKIDSAFFAEKNSPWKYGPRRDNQPENSYSLLYILHGGFYHSVEGKEKILIPPGSLVLQKFDRNLYCNTSAELPTSYLVFSFRTLEEIPMDLPLQNYFIPAEEAAPQSEEKMTAIIHLYQERPFGWKTRLRGIAEELLLSILKAYYEERSDTMPPLIVESTTVIRKRIFSDLLSVEDVARDCGVTAAHLIRTFNRYLDMTPKKYMDRVRVEMACDLLKYTSKSIDEIAELSGFSEARQMRRVFHEIMGASPREYRKQI